MLVCPESPRWLESKGRHWDATEAARRLWGTSSELTQQAKDTPQDVSGQRSVQNTSTGKYNRAIIIGCALFFFQQLSGINAVVYFSSQVFSEVGIASQTLASAAVGVTNVLGTVVAAVLMDRRGRKQLLGGSFLGPGASMLLLVAGLTVPALGGWQAQIAMGGTLLYVLSFALGTGPVPALVVPEILSAKVRGKGVSLALTTHWICNFAIGQLFLQAKESFGVATVYNCFALVCFAGAAFVHNQLVETKGKSLEQVEQEMAAR